jgi:hypothetical protein
MNFLIFPPGQVRPITNPTVSRDMDKEKIWIAKGHLNVSTSAVGIDRSQLFLAIVLGLCCSAGLLLTADSTLNQVGLIDPYFYRDIPTTIMGYYNGSVQLLRGPHRLRFSSSRF